MFDAADVLSVVPSKMFLLRVEPAALLGRGGIMTWSAAVRGGGSGAGRYRPEARRVAVRGGGSCHVRVPVAGGRPARARPSTPHPPLRLTPRGRLVLIVLPGVLVVVGLLVAVLAPAAATSAPPARTLVVQAGDTLWGVAERVAPHRDPRVVVAELQWANHLRDARVPAGLRLAVPPGIDG